MNSHALYEAKNNNSIDCTKKRDVNVPNISEMEDTGLQDGVDIDAMLSASTLFQYSNMEFNNESNSTFINSTTSPSKYRSISIFTSPAVNSINYEVCSFKTQYSRISSIQICLKLKQELFVV